LKNLGLPAGDPSIRVDSIAYFIRWPNGFSQIPLFKVSHLLKNIFIFLIVALFSYIGPLFGATPELDEKTILNSANTLFLNGDFDGAISQATDFLNKFPDSLNKDQVFFILGEAQYKKSHLTEAKEAYKQIVERFKTSPVYPQAYAQLAFVSFDLGEFDQAEPIFEELLDQVKEPQKKVEIYDKLFEIMNKREDWTEAIDFLLLKAKLISTPPDLQQINNKVISLIQNKMSKRVLWSIAGKYPKDFPGDYAYLQLISLYDQEKDTFHFEKTVKKFSEHFPKNENSESLGQKVKLISNQIKKHKNVIGLLLPSLKQAEDITDQVINGANLALWDYQKETNDDSIAIAFKEAGGQGNKISAETELFVKEYAPKAVMGPLFSKDFESIGGLAESYAIPFITPTATHPGVTLRSKFLLRNGLTSPLQAKEVADYAMTQGGMKRVVIFYPRNSYGEELSRAFADEVTRLGGEIIVQESYPPDSVDFSQEIKHIVKVDLSKYGIQGEKIEEKDFKHKIKRDYTPGFDSIFLPGEGMRAGLIPSQLAFFDIKGVAFYGSNGWNSPEFLKAGGKYLEGGVFPDGFFIDASSTQTTQFVARYRKTFQMDPTIFSAQSYDAMNMIIQAIKNGAVTGGQVRSAILGMNPYEGVTGTTRFGASGEAEKKAFILQIKNGKLHQVN
jgi:branched-chain amino acid transport system substrate-binding protein